MIGHRAKQKINPSDPVFAAIFMQDKASFGVGGRTECDPTTMHRQCALGCLSLLNGGASPNGSLFTSNDGKDKTNF